MVENLAVEIHYYAGAQLSEVIFISRLCLRLLLSFLVRWVMIMTMVGECMRSHIYRNYRWVNKSVFVYYTAGVSVSLIVSG
jgi:hypothetical protein